MTGGEVYLSRSEHLPEVLTYFGLEYIGPKVFSPYGRAKQEDNGVLDTPVIEGKEYRYYRFNSWEGKVGFGGGGMGAAVEF